MKQPQAPSVKGKNIKAKLDLTISVTGSAGGSSSQKNITSVSSYESTDSGKSSVDGKAIVSISFEEAPAFPDTPGSPTVLAPIGSFTYYIEKKSVDESKWSSSEKVLGDYIAHPQKQGSAQRSSIEEATTRCDGSEVYQGATYQTRTTPAVNMPGVKLPPKSAKMLDVKCILYMEEQPDGSTKYSFSVSTMGKCTVKSAYKSDSESSGSGYDSGELFSIDIEGTLPKGQKSVSLGPGNVRHSFPTEIDMGGQTKPVKIMVTGTLGFLAGPGKLEVTPGDSLASTGPDDKNKFNPSSKTYVLKNTGESAIKYSVSKTQNWLGLSATEGTLEPRQTSNVIVSINEQAAKTLKAGDYKDTVTFTNVTNGTGNTTRQATLSTVEEQTWRVSLTGQETDDVGGQLMYMKVKDKWKYREIDFGVRFNYTKLTAEFTIKKVKGKWKYKEGKITSATVTPIQVFDPSVFFVKSTVCRNCDRVNGLAGTSINGEVDGNTVRLAWPKITTIVSVQNKLKLESGSKEESHKGYSSNEFYSECFFDYACNHDLPLKEGELKPFKQERKSYVNQYRQDKKKPIYLYHQYFMKRIK